MYIWILLATIMVALSFLNTSPREDKAGVFTEIKAATVVNRFRAEHLAFYRGTECEMIYNWNSGNYDIPYECTKNNNCLSKMEDNLPLGYDITSIQSTHAIYCFDDNIQNGANLKKCSSDEGSKNKYAISFAKIPERWYSKTETEITIPEGESSRTVKMVAPTPNFTNYLAKELSGVKNMGWMWCEGTGSTAKCHLVGRTAIQIVYEKKPQNAKGSIAKYVSFVFPKVFYIGSDNASKAFQKKCMQGEPCLFAFDKYRNADVSGHCYGQHDNSGE